MTTSKNLHALNVQEVPIADLHPDPANARKHEARSIDSLKASLSAYGQRKPIVVQRSGMIVRSGNGLLAAAKALGWTTIVATIVDDDTLTAVQYAIADNRSAELSRWDDRVLATLLESLDAPQRTDVGFDAPEFAALMERVKAFDPNTDPTATDSTVTSDDVTDAAEEMGGQFGGPGAAKLEVCCPGCGKVFEVDDQSN